MASSSRKGNFEAAFKMGVIEFAEGNTNIGARKFGYRSYKSGGRKQM